MTSPPLVLEDGDRIASDLEGAGRARLYRVVLFVFSIGIPTDVMLASRFGSSSVILGAPLAAAAAWQLVTTGRFRRIPPPLLALTAFVAWAAASIFWAAKPESVVKSVTTYVQLLAFVWLAWQLLRTEADLRATVLGFLTGCTIIVAEQWQSFFAGRSFRDAAWEGSARFVAEGFDPNDAGVTLALGIPMATYLLLTSARRARLLMFAYFPIAASGLALTGSRGSTITAAITVLAVLVWIGRRSRLMLVLAFAALAGALLFAWSYVPWDAWARLFTIREQLAQGSFGDRRPIWYAGLMLLLAHPLAGVGSGGFADAVVPAIHLRIVAHSTPLTVAAELGVIGLAAFYSAHFLGLRLAARAPANPRALAFTLFVAWLVGSASLSWTTRKATWFAVLLFSAIGALHDHAARERH